jgi:predicted chitinase
MNFPGLWTNCPSWSIILSIGQILFSRDCFEFTRYKDAFTSTPRGGKERQILIITAENLKQIMPNLTPQKRALYLPFLNRVMEEYGISNPFRCAHFLAQLAHESGELRYMEEIWGPTPAQNRYEPPSLLAEKLGNTERGDGKRFKGRGPIQITGRRNYELYGQQLGVDLVSNPALAATPQIGFSIAGLYWRSNGLNQLADIDDIVSITKRINGGVNGLAERRAYCKRAKAVLFATRTAVTPSTPAPLMRGFEAVREETSPRARGSAGSTGKATDKSGQQQ